MPIKLPKNYGTIEMLRYMIKRVIIQARLVDKQLKSKEIDYNMLFTHIYTLHGYMNLTLKVLKEFNKNLMVNKNEDKGQG